MIKSLYIWKKKEFPIFKGIISKPDTKITVDLILANLKKDNENKEENFSA